MVESPGGHTGLRSRTRLCRAWTLWRRTPRQSLGASRPVIDLIVIFVLPPGIIAWGIADVLGAEGRSLVDRLFGVFPPHRRVAAVLRVVGLPAETCAKGRVTARDDGER